MEKMIAELNLEHFRRKLAGETDPEKCGTLRRLIVEEEGHLAAIVAEERELGEAAPTFRRAVSDDT